MNRALQLLARAADGSLRDALSLTDQAIAMGQGQVTTASVSQMLGTLDDEQPLALIEALAKGDGAQVMSLLDQVAARGVDWESLLVETQTLLHRIAMVQLLPAALGDDYAAVEARMRDLARALPPTDVQLYYQTMLIGRKELPFAPDRRMGVEMTLLRALAFHPSQIIAEPVARVQVAQASAIQPAVPQSVATASAKIRTPAPQYGETQADVLTPSYSPEPPMDASAYAPPLGEPPASVGSAEQHGESELPDATSQLLQARSQLLRKQGSTPPKRLNRQRLTTRGRQPQRWSG